MKTPGLSFCFLLFCGALTGLAQGAKSQFESITNAAADLAVIQARLENKSAPITWVFTGDSITHGASHTHGERSYHEHFAERVRWEMGRRRDVVVNTGISGDTADGILKDFEHRVARFKPDVVSIMIAMNDCAGGPEARSKFESNLRELIRRVRSTGVAPLLHTTNPIDTSRESRRNDLPAYNEIIVKVALAESVVLVDHWTHWRKQRPGLASLNEWLNDPVHPNARGHREFAILLFRVLGIYDDKSPTCQPVDPSHAPK
jgi:acyl-CoA thioesterase I